MATHGSEPSISWWARRRSRASHAAIRHWKQRLSAKDAMRRALRIGIDEGHRRITPHHLLAALALGRPNDPAIRLLHTAGIDPSTLRHSIWSSGRFGTAGPPEFWTV